MLRNKIEQLLVQIMQSQKLCKYCNIPVKVEYWHAKSVNPKVLVDSGILIE